MNISDYLKKETVSINLKSKTKNEIISEIYNNLYSKEYILDKEKCLNDILDREKQGSTGIGNMVAIPHAKSNTVNELVMTIGISKEDIDYDSIDGKKTRVFFMFLAPDEKAQEYLVLLSKISRLIKDEVFVNTLLSANSNEELIEIIETKGK